MSEIIKIIKLSITTHIFSLLARKIKLGRDATSAKSYRIILLLGIYLAIPYTIYILGDVMSKKRTVIFKRNLGRRLYVVHVCMLSLGKSGS